MPGVVSLNGVDYVVTERKVRGRNVPLDQEQIDPFAAVQSDKGVQRLEQITTRSAVLFPSLVNGLTHDAVAPAKADDPEQYKGFYDSTLETRYEGGVWLGVLNEESTEAADGEVIRCSVTSSVAGSAKLYSFWDREASGPLRGVIVSDYDGSATSWNATVTVVYNSGTDETGVQDCITHKDRMVVLFWTSNDYLTRNSTDGTTWNTPTTEVTANMTSNLSDDNPNNNVGKLAEIGSELVAVLAHRNNRTVTFNSSTNAGVDWTDEAVDIPGMVVLGVAVYPGVDGEDKLYVLTDDALYEVDTAPATWTFVRILNNSQQGTFSHSHRLVAHSDGKLWIAMSCGDSEAVPVYTLDTSQGNRTIGAVGLNQNDYIPAELLGSAQFIRSYGDMIYMSVGGHGASRNSRVLAHNGKGWHSMYRHGTANLPIEWMDLSQRDDDVPRLHYAIRLTDSTVDTEFLANAMESPLSGTTIKRQSSGYADLPYVDGGMPTQSASWLQARVDAADLSSDNTGEYINLDYGVNSAARSGTDLGDILSGTLSLDWASGAGVPGRNLGMRVNLLRDAGTNTDSPRFKSLEVDYLKHLDTLERYTMTIDVAASAILQRGTPETVMTKLEAAQDLKTLPAFTYGSLGTKYVKVRGFFWSPHLTAAGAQSRAVAPDALAQRAGYVDLILEQVVS